MDFYFAASGVIPILALAVLIEAKPLGQRKGPRWLERLLSKVSPDSVDAMERGAYWHVPALGLYVGWAEFICLRTLETGHAAWGGAPVVWAALALLAALALVFAWLTSLPQAEDRPSDV